MSFVGVARIGVGWSAVTSFQGRWVAQMLPTILSCSAVGAIERHQSSIVHFAEGRLNPSTIAWVIAEVEKELLSAGENGN
jgi:hypothetical protein